MITVDTSALFVLLNRRDPDHEAAKRALDAAGRPYLVPGGILAEIAYLLEQRMPTTVDRLLADLESGAFALESGEQDLTRIRELVRRYVDLRLGVADAAVIACAERNGGLVLTFDLRDFSVVAREGRIQVASVGRVMSGPSAGSASQCPSQDGSARTIERAPCSLMIAPAGGTTSALASSHVYTPAPVCGPGCSHVVLKEG